MPKTVSTESIRNDHHVKPSWGCLFKSTALRNTCHRNYSNTMNAKSDSGYNKQFKPPHPKHRHTYAPTHKTGALKNSPAIEPFCLHKQHFWKGLAFRRQARQLAAAMPIIVASGLCKTGSVFENLLKKMLKNLSKIF